MPAATFYQPIEKILDGHCKYEYYNQSTNSYSRDNKSRICRINLENLDTSILMMIFTIRNQPSREKPYVWKIHSEGPKRTDPGSTVPLRNTAVKLSKENKWKYIAIAVASEDVPTSDIISEYVISMESYQYGNDTVYDLSNDLEKLKNLGKPNFYRTQVSLGGVKYSFSFIKKDKLIDYLRIFDNRPYDKNTKDDEYDFNVYGLHITQKNSALDENNSHVCIGWSNLGDLTSIQSKDELNELYSTIRPDHSNQKRGANVSQIWMFKDEIKVNDYVVYFDKGIAHIGKVVGEYEYIQDTPNQDVDYVNNRKVEWIKDIAYKDLPTEYRKSALAQKSVFRLSSYKPLIQDIISGNELHIDEFDDVNDESVDKDKILATFTFKESTINDGQNLIVYGTPGCGKSYYVEHTLLKDYPKDNYIRTTFFQDYTNTDFVGQILPVVEGEKVTYKFNPGPFTLALEKAIENPQERFALVIEELNRGSAASIFGDIFQLLDRKEGVSEYSINNVNVINYLKEKFEGKYTFDSIRLPGNLSIFATMNTSDQNVFTLDTAFKRRWKFKKLLNKFENDHQFKDKFIPGADITWKDFVNGINKFILDSSNGLNSEDKQLGVYFVDENGMRQEKVDVSDPKAIEDFAYKVLEYLWADVAKFDRSKWFAENIKSLDDLVDEYKTNGIGAFNHDVFNK